jgi:alpha-D-ribose 1-methylphosphonate 5-triphosphate synthase subunit PhnG
MRTDKYRNIHRCVLAVYDLESDGRAGGTGNSAIARRTGLTRATVNRLMKEAQTLGYVSVKQVDWRQPNVVAKRYAVRSAWITRYLSAARWYAGIQMPLPREATTC